MIREGLFSAIVNTIQYSLDITVTLQGIYLRWFVLSRVNKYSLTAVTLEIRDGEFRCSPIIF